MAEALRKALGKPALILPDRRLWRPGERRVLRPRLGLQPIEHGFIRGKGKRSGLQPLGEGFERDGIQAIATLTWIASGGSASNASSYNFGNFTAPEDGLMIVVAIPRAGGAVNLTSISIGGSSGTIHESIASSASPLGIASRAVSAGAHNVTVNLSATIVNCSVGVWLLTGYSSATPDDTDQSSGTAASRSATLTMATNGRAVFGGLGFAGDFSWSAATTRYQSTVESSDRHEAADYSGAGSHTETISGFSVGAIIGATWH